MWAMADTGIAVYGTATSGHTHRVMLFLNILGVPHHRIDTPAAARATPEFRALNPLGQIPTIRDGGLVLADSNAILVYLARKYAPGSGWLPDEPEAAARVQRWLSIAAGEVRYGPAMARLITLWRRPGDVAAARAAAADLLRFMDAELAARPFAAGERPTIADLSLYPYIAHAPEGRVSLEPYPAVRAWLARIEALPGFVAMPATAIPEGAP